MEVERNITLFETFLVPCLDTVYSTVWYLSQEEEQAEALLLETTLTVFVAFAAGAHVEDLDAELLRILCQHFLRQRKEPTKSMDLATWEQEADQFLISVTADAVAESEVAPSSKGEKADMHRLLSGMPVEY